MLVLSACNSSGALSPREIEKINNEETYANSMAALSVVVSSMDALYDLAEAVAVVTVEDTAAEMVYSFPQTVSTVQVNRVYLGNISEGDTIYIREEGGSIDGQTYSIGVPVLAAGDTALLFLIDSGLGNEGEYCIVGAYQGKFIQREGYYFQQATAEVKLDSAQYYPQDDIGMEQLIAAIAG